MNLMRHGTDISRQWRLNPDASKEILPLEKMHATSDKLVVGEVCCFSICADKCICRSSVY